MLVTSRYRLRSKERHLGPPCVVTQDKFSKQTRSESRQVSVSYRASEFIGVNVTPHTETNRAGKPIDSA